MSWQEGTLKLNSFPVAVLPIQLEHPAGMEQPRAGGYRHASLQEKRNEGYREVSRGHTHVVDTEEFEQGASLPGPQLRPGLAACFSAAFSSAYSLCDESDAPEAELSDILSFSITCIIYQFQKCFSRG